MSAEPGRGDRVVVAAIVVVAAAFRIWIALQPGLWADEFFSLAIATGHSLEHPAAIADPALGDWIEPAGAEPAAFFRRYLAHETPPAGAARVLRAVRLSDTSPPLYYLALDWWLRLAGTSDAALRLFSTACALAAFPLLWSVARVLGGTRVAVLACFLFAFAPPALYYSAEGRMYALTWLLGLALARVTLVLGWQSRRPAWMVAWTVLAAAGLLTHYFLVFVVLAMLAWLATEARTLRWHRLAALTVGVAVLVAPWYADVPASLRAWRVTGDWLAADLGAGALAFGAIRLGASLLNGFGVWGGSYWAMLGQFPIYAVVAIAVVARGGDGLAEPKWRLPLLWTAAAVLGPIAFDVLRHTGTSLVERYALPGLPAAILLFALALDHVARPLGIAMLAATVIAWLPGIRDVPSPRAHAWAPYRTAAATVTGFTRPNDLVVVDSIPSGVLGIARYVDPATPIASWVVPLERRTMPADAERLTADRCRIAVVRIHDLGKVAPIADWLRVHATAAGERWLFEDESVVLFFTTDRC